MNLYLSYFYTSAELPIRLSRWWASMTFAIIIGAFLAFGILHLDGVGGVEGWRWLFLIEGIITASVGVSAFFFMPPSPTQTAGFPRGKKGWFTERYEAPRKARNQPVVLTHPCTAKRLSSSIGLCATTRRKEPCTIGSLLHPSSCSRLFRTIIYGQCKPSSLSL